MTTTLPPPEAGGVTRSVGVGLTPWPNPHPLGQLVLLDFEP
jgi:hypothetical protein